MFVRVLHDLSGVVLPKVFAGCSLLVAGQLNRSQRFSGHLYAVVDESNEHFSPDPVLSLQGFHLFRRESNDDVTSTAVAVQIFRMSRYAVRQHNDLPYTVPVAVEMVDSEHIVIPFVFSQLFAFESISGERIGVNVQLQYDISGVYWFSAFLCIGVCRRNESRQHRHDNYFCQVLHNVMYSFSIPK